MVPPFTGLPVVVVLALPAQAVRDPPAGRAPAASAAIRGRGGWVMGRLAGSRVCRAPFRRSGTHAFGCRFGVVPAAPGPLGARRAVELDCGVSGGQRRALLTDREVGAAAVARRGVPLGQPVTLTEDSLAQRLVLVVRRPEPSAGPQLGHDELDEVRRRVEAVVLEEVDAVDADVVEPGLDAVGNLGRRTDGEQWVGAEIAEPVAELTDRLVRVEAAPAPEVTRGTGDVAEPGLWRVRRRVERQAGVGHVPLGANEAL